MKNKTVFTLLFFSIIFLSSCGSSFVGEKRLDIYMGYSIVDFKKINYLTSENNYHKLSGWDLDKIGTIEIYIVQQPSVKDKLDVYIYAFQNGKLLYWGFPWEFTRSNDKVIEAIGIEAIKLMEKE